MDLSGVLLSMWRVFADASLEIVPYFFLALVLGALIEECPPFSVCSPPSEPGR